MASDLEFKKIYEDIHSCRKCSSVKVSEVPRVVNQAACRSGIVLLAQAPSENGVRKSGIHWVGADGCIRRPGGVFLDKYLKQIGYSVDPAAIGFTRPYTTNVLQCWPGKNGKRDRKPTKDELQRCKQWWLKEVELIKPRVIILLGQRAAEAVEFVLRRHRSFKELLSPLCQGEEWKFEHFTTKRYVVPHPTAGYVDKSKIYQTVVDLVREYGPTTSCSPT